MKHNGTNESNVNILDIVKLLTFLISEITKMGR